MALPSNTKRKVFDGRYEVLSIVGRGTDSVVYHARHIQGSQQEVALKVLLNQKSQVSLSERLRKEALTLVSCRHKYVVRLDDFHSVDDLCYLSMEFASEGDLRKLLAALGTALPSERAERYLRQCLEALDFIHATGVIHRDIKPDNILVLNENEIRLADFGIALLPGDEVDIDELQKGVGSFSYLPPELVQGVGYDERSDLYSLGLCFYEALAGFHPFDRLPIAEQLEARKDGKIAPLHEIQPSVPQYLSDIIQKLIRYDADERFQSALETIRTLDKKELSSSAAVREETAAAATISSDIRYDSDSVPMAANASSQPSSNSSYFDDLEDDEDFDIPSTDTAPQKSPERVPQPTEEIDLERIKEILAKDAEQKSSIAARRNRNDSVAAAMPASQAPVRQEPYALKPKEQKSKQPSRKARSASAKPFGPKTHVGRLVTVGLAAAALTVISLVLVQKAPKLSLSSLLSSVTGSSRGSFTGPAAEVPAVVDPLHPADGEVASAEASFPRIPGGLYSGGIEGVIPGLRSPIALISMPAKSEVVVIVGLDGWAPAASSVLEEGSAQSNTLVVRSNGVILNLSGEMSGDAITGTFVNTMTGESGTWSVRKIS